jgi:hypothetical protein
MDGPRVARDTASGRGLNNWAGEPASIFRSTFDGPQEIWTSCDPTLRGGRYGQRSYKPRISRTHGRTDQCLHT